MEAKGTPPILGFIRKIVAAGEIRQLTDGQLLQRYRTQNDEAAFEILVQRHGAMVWRICRNVLREVHAAEDAFQATFLLLVRKVASIDRPELLGNWLYGVACRVALRARKMITQREVHERQRATMLPRAPEETVEPDLQPLLHEELQRLPPKYRFPMVLCYLEGRTNEEAAQQLQWPVGTLKVRLMRGRQMLRTRLTRRVLALSAAAMTSMLAENAASAVPEPLLETTMRAAASFATGNATGLGVLSAHALALTEGVLKTMWWSQLKFVAAVLFAVGLLGASLFTVRMLAADQSPRREAPALLRAPSPAADAGAEARRKAELKKLQGTWNVAALEIDGAKVVGPAFQGSKIIVQDDAFTTISMGAAYKGTLKIDPNSTPKKLDLVFTEGPEKGKTNLGIYELDGDTWKICLALAGNTRPVEFVTKVGSGFALEILQRQAEEKNSETLDKEFSRLEGEWSMVSGEHDGQRVPEGLLKLWKRVAKGKETTVTFSGQVMLQGTFTLDMSKKPKTIDYTMAEGPNKGKKQYGIYEWDGDQIRFCFAVPGKDRPKEFATKAGDQQTLSVWKKVTP